MAPFEIRGSLAGRNELMIVVGQLAAFVVNAIIAQLFGHQPGVWRIMFSICALPAIVLFFGMLRMPESPRWYVEKGRNEEALAVLKTIRSDERAEAEFAEVSHVAEEEHEQASKALGLRAVLSNKNLVYILLIACGLGIAQQFTGVNAIMYYGQRMLAEGWLQRVDDRVGEHRPRRHRGDRWHDRPVSDGPDQPPDQLPLGLGLTALSHLFIVIGMAMFPVGNPLRPWVFLVLIVFMIGSIQLFLNLAVWVYLSEVFPLHMRGIGMGVSVFVLWVANGVIALNVPSVVAALGMGLFVIFAVANAISFLFVLKFVPETRGRTLEELEERVTDGSIFHSIGNKG